MLSGKKYIIFDMDGTLIDSIGVWNETDVRFAKALGGDVTGVDVQARRDEKLREFKTSDAPYRDYCGYLGALYGSALSPDELLKLRYDIAEDLLVNEIDYKPDAETFLHILKEMGYTLLVASTTKRSNMDTYCEKNAKIRSKALPEDIFAAIYTREDAKEMKPSPEIYERIFREWNTCAEECIVFEDSLVGVEAANNAGIDVVAMYDKYSDRDRAEINARTVAQFQNYKEALRAIGAERATMITAGLKPERVFYYFEKLSAIPHGSGNTDAISDYCMEVAKGLGLDAEKDAWNNVIIRKAASAGYENRPTVILQGHLDMVCEKDADCPIDFEKDGLALCIDGDFLYAKGTTLGGDDGIAIAMALAVLEDNTLAHPPIEALFTTDEETGMYGAEGLDASRLVGSTLLNIDSEEEGILTVSCAGGARACVELPLTEESVSMPCYTVTLGGLIGGHSGVEIGTGRQNANVMLGKFLAELPFAYRIVTIGGGMKDNAIPRECTAVLACAENPAEFANAFVAKNRVAADPDLSITVAPADAVATAYDEESSNRIATFLSTVANGVQKMSADIAGLVQTSLNLGILKVENNTLVATFAVRSSVDREKLELLADVEATANKLGGSFSSHAHYPAWEYRKDSPLRDTMVQVYERLYGASPEVVAIHAGLECGLFAGKIADLDAVSFGPNLYDIHTSRERLSITSTERTYTYLCAILKAL